MNKKLSLPQIKRNMHDRHLECQLKAGVHLSVVQILLESVIN